MIDKKIKKFKNKKVIEETSTLEKEKAGKIFKKFTYPPVFHSKFQQVFKEFNISLAPQNKFTIKNLIKANKILNFEIPGEKDLIQKFIRPPPEKCQITMQQPEAPVGN